MNAYRVYFIDGGNTFSGFKDLSCASDMQAIAEAVKLLSGQHGEVWQLGRKVAKIAPDGSVIRI